VHYLVPAVHAPILSERLGPVPGMPVPRDSALSAVLPPFLSAVVDWQHAAAGGGGGALEASLVGPRRPAPG
jgi:hypothetical protein